MQPAIPPVLWQLCIGLLTAAGASAFVNFGRLRQGRFRWWELVGIVMLGLVYAAFCELAVMVFNHQVPDDHGMVSLIINILAIPGVIGLFTLLIVPPALIGWFVGQIVALLVWFLWRRARPGLSPS